MRKLNFLKTALATLGLALLFTRALGAQEWPQMTNLNYKGPLGVLLSCARLKNKVNSMNPVRKDEFGYDTRWEFLIQHRSYLYSNSKGYLMFASPDRIFMATCPSEQGARHWWLNEWTSENCVVRIERGFKDPAEPRILLNFEDFEPRNGTLLHWSCYPEVQRIEFVADNGNLFLIKFIQDRILYTSISADQSWALNPKLIPRMFAFDSDFFRWLKK
jgi:hypothetical protein